MNVKPLIELLQRISKSPYKTFVMSNRMIMQCYTVDEDDDVGLHYILHIPDTDEYMDEFYDETLILDPKEILTCYTRGHSLLLEKKRAVNAKSKEIKEEAFFRIKRHKAVLKFLYYVQDDLITTEEYIFSYPIDLGRSEVSVICQTYSDMINRIKIGGIGIAFNGDDYNLYSRAMQYPDIYFFKVKMRDTKVKIPLYKSLFGALKSWDEFFISVQETILPNIYLYAVQFTAKDITEQYIGYIQNF